MSSFGAIRQEVEPRSLALLTGSIHLEGRSGASQIITLLLGLILQSPLSLGFLASSAPPAARKTAPEVTGPCHSLAEIIPGFLSPSATDDNILPSVVGRRPPNSGHVVGATVAGRPRTQSSALGQ